MEEDKGVTELVTPGGKQSVNELQLAFNYETLPVRTITDGIAVWFALKDVCYVYTIEKNTRSSHK